LKYGIEQMLKHETLGNIINVASSGGLERGPDVLVTRRQRRPGQSHAISGDRTWSGGIRINEIAPSAGKRRS
jgi:hypothetical protein